MDDDMKKDLNIMKIIMVVISIIIFVFFLSQVNVSWNIELELQSIDSNTSPKDSILAWLFVGVIGGMLYYSFLCLIAMILWMVMNRKHPEANQSYTIVTRSGKSFTKHKWSKYDEQMEIIWFQTLVIVSVIETSLVVFMYMFGVIQLV